MNWKVIDKVDWVQLGRGCTRCKGSGSEEDAEKQKCKCTAGDDSCSAGQECKCAKAGKCCKCCCNGRCGKCSNIADRECSCVKEEKKNGTSDLDRRIYHDSYQSAYGEMSFLSIYDGSYFRMRSTWTDLLEMGGSMTPSQRRHHCARTLLGSVCLIWSGITYMYWTGKYHKDSPRWNNHILDGSGLDDGTLSQWLQALGFPRKMLNNSGPQNRLDKVIWDGLRDMLYLGFPDTKDGTHGKDEWNNTFRNPASMNFAGYIHTLEKGAFDSSVFTGNGTDNSVDKNKLGAIFKLYILSCAYFTGLQKRSTHTTPRTPKTIREILYWLSALPYSKAYPKILKHGKQRLKEVLKKPGDAGSSANNNETQLKFHQTGLTHPFTVDEYNLFAHFQAVTQYCPLVLIGIQGGLHSTKGTDKTTEPPIHSLYANTECHFTYPGVSIQAYNQVVHYIRALFYQLYFLRKQCAVKVAMGGKWRECRYGNGVVSKGVISWMCLGCDPMEHDRKKRVGKVNGEILKGVTKGDAAVNLKAVLENIGDVVVQLGNAQEALEGKKKEAIEKVKVALGTAKQGLEKAKTELEEAVKKDGLNVKLDEAKAKLDALTNGSGGSGILKDVEDALGKATNGTKEVDPGKNGISAAIKGVRDALEEFEKGVEKIKKEKVKDSLDCLQDDTFTSSDIIAAANEVEREYTTLLSSIDQLISICNTAKCSACESHSTKCGKQSNPTICKTCHQPTTTGVPSPLQAFLEDRLPGFSCKEVVNDAKENPDYPPAASHLGHCNGSGQCCPLPMGFRGQFHQGSTGDMTGSRLFGILYFFSNENMMQSCVYTLVRVTAALSATTPQVLGDVFGFFRGGVGNKDRGKPPNGSDGTPCNHDGNPSGSYEANKTKYFCGWCASGLRDEVQKIEWIYNGSENGGEYMKTVGQALRDIKDDKGSVTIPLSDTQSNNTSLSRLTENCQYLSPLTGELYTAVSATFGGTYLSWVLYLSDALQGGLESLSEAFQQIECRGCRECDPNKCKKGEHGKDSGLCGCQSIVSCTGVLPVLYRHGFSYGNPFNLEGYQQNDTDKGDYSITDKGGKKHCHEFLESLNQVIKTKE